MHTDGENSFMKHKYTTGLEMLNKDTATDCMKLAVLFVLHVSSRVTHSASFVLPLNTYVTVEL